MTGTTDTTGTATRGAVPVPGAGRAGGPSVGWTELLVAIPLYLLLSGASGIVLYVVGGGDVLGSAVPVLALGGACTLLTACAVLALRVRWLPAAGLRRTTTGWVLAGVAAGLLTRVVAAGIGWGYQQLTGDTSNPQAFIGTSLAGGDLVTLGGVMLAGALLVPFAEELLFRGIGYGALRRYGARVAVPAAAALFALAHGLNIVLAVAFVLGVVCALLYERSRSIWPAVVTHAVFNASGFLLAALLS
ncbi:CPBP family intramembrane glutamic endopeptidase [Pseudonocardia sp. HH130630-07]|uniref:CPBP family intramembrane glutamic endopeptidase n=1 Tax=Pseudonocardia sp. HH130630-07 TaxID=1690815 RepID=UPI0008150A0F|nr:CPBP family intramembrane glutamic endopeptidase [Pseudonocardia sp. HH130630-07]ANY09505.1 hypothetical protein AFB00_28355 [Pseudonocardia sp. HH130630-07]